MRVLVAVRDELMRRAVRIVLAEAAAVKVTGEASGVAGAVELLGAGRVEVVVVDRRVGGGAGAQSVRELRARVPGTSVVVIGMSEDSGVACEAISAGAAAYVLMDTAETDLVEAVLAAARGGCFVSPVLAQRLRAQMRAEPRELSELHTAVLCLLARGHTDARVVAQLEISTAVLEASRGEIYRRLGMASRAELARYALRHGLLACG